MIAVISPYIALMRLNKPIGILLLLWPTLISLWLASDGTPQLSNIIIFCLGVLVMRSAGCVINDFADRNFDGQVLRTKHRPLAIKAISPKHALLLFAFLLCVALYLVSFLNAVVIMLSMIAALLAVIYPFSKRFTNYPQFLLGLAFAWSIPMAYMQVRNHIPIEAWLVLTATIMWVIAYDTLYALVDINYDLQLGIKSTAITFGKHVQTITLALHVLSILIFVYIGVNRNSNEIYYMGLCGAFLCAIYQHRMIKLLHPEQCFKAFLHNNYFGMSIFLGILLGAI